MKQEACRIAFRLNLKNEHLRPGFSKNAQAVHLRWLQHAWKWWNENYQHLLFLFWEQWATLQIEEGVKKQKALALGNLISTGKTSEWRWYSTIRLVKSQFLISYLEKSRQKHKLHLMLSKKTGMAKMDFDGQIIAEVINLQKRPEVCYKQDNWWMTESCEEKMLETSMSRERCCW